MRVGTGFILLSMALILESMKAREFLCGIAKHCLLERNGASPSTNQ